MIRRVLAWARWTGYGVASWTRCHLNRKDHR